MDDSGKLPEPKPSDEAVVKPLHQKFSRRKKFWIRLFIIFTVLAVTIALVLHLYQNGSFTSRDAWPAKVDASIERGLQWLQLQESDFLQQGNIALFFMIQDMKTLHPDPYLVSLHQKILSRPMKPNCWKRMLLSDHTVSTIELNNTIQGEILDNQRTLYALAPDKARLSPAQMEEFFQPNRWQHRQLTHQLWALVHLKKHTPDNPDIDPLINQLCDRLSRELAWDRAVTDIYIQKIAFTLFAGHPEKINRRWIERVIENQEPDGGWNDRWLYAFRSQKRPALDLTNPPTDAHATIQALWLLYQAKYRYPQSFALSNK